MAILSFQKPESNEIPSKVVKGVMRLAKQLKMKGYKNGGSSSDTDSSDDEGSSDEDGDGSTSDSEDDRTYRHSRKSTKKAKKSYKHSGRKNDDTKKRNHQVEDESMRDEMKQLRVMIQDLMKSQKAPSASMELINARPDRNIIPLDSYVLNRTYRGYPQQERYEYIQFNHGQSTNRQPQYNNRRSQGHPPATTEYNRTIGRGREPARMSPTPFEPSHNSYAAPGGGSPPTQPIMGPNGVLYYPARNSVVCYNVLKRGIYVRIARSFGHTVSNQWFPRMEVLLLSVRVNHYHHYHHHHLQEGQIKRLVLLKSYQLLLHLMVSEYVKCLQLKSMKS